MKSTTAPRRSHWLRGIGLALTLGLLCTLAALPTAAQGNGYVWSVRTTIKCPDPTCQGWFLLPPWIKSQVTRFDAVSDSDGNFTFTSVTVAVGRSDNPERCRPSMFTRPFSGRCVIRESGRGYIARGDALYPKRDFFITRERVSFNGGPWIRNPFGPYPMDTYNLAVPGRWTTVDFLGYKPRGVTYTEVVTREPR